MTCDIFHVLTNTLISIFILQWLELDPFVPRSEYGSLWSNQSENVDHGPKYQHPPQLSPDAYPPPPPG